MLDKRRSTRLIRQMVVIVGIVVTLFPVYLVLVASTHSLREIVRAPMSVLPGGEGLTNYLTALVEGDRSLGSSAALMTMNSSIIALGIAIGKIVISLLAAYAIVYFRFPLRDFCFWSIFITLMLPIEVRILPSYQVASDLNLLNSYIGLTLPLMVSATGVFLFRQFFMSVPSEIPEAAKIDGTTPLQFFGYVLLPMTRTAIAAMFVIQFIFGWNQYLWPLLITTRERFYNLLIGINRMISVGEQQVDWNIVMAVTVLSIFIPSMVIFLMQRLFVRGMIVSEK